MMMLIGSTSYRAAWDSRGLGIVQSGRGDGEDGGNIEKLHLGCSVE